METLDLDALEKLALAFADAELPFPKTTVLALIRALRDARAALVKLSDRCACASWERGHHLVNCPAQVALNALASVPGVAQEGDRGS